MIKELTQTIQIRKKLTDPQKVELLDQIAKATDHIAELELQIDDLKEQMKPLKDAIESENDNIAQAIVNYKAGFLPINIDCIAKYDNGIAVFYDVTTGEKVDERPITDDEQLRLNENRIDAETLIREDSKNQD